MNKINLLLISIISTTVFANTSITKSIENSAKKYRLTSSGVGTLAAGIGLGKVISNNQVIGIDTTQRYYSTGDILAIDYKYFFNKNTISSSWYFNSRIEERGTLQSLSLNTSTPSMSGGYQHVFNNYIFLDGSIGYKYQLAYQNLGLALFAQLVHPF